MVLHLRDEDLVPGADPRLAEGPRRQVQGLGRAAGEHDLVGLRPDERRHLGPRPLVEVGRLRGQGVHPPAHVGVGLPVQAGLGLDHRGRFLTRGRGVEVHERVPVHHASKDREIVADPGVHQPTARSKLISRSPRSSIEYSSGISFRIGDTNPFTMSDIAWASDSPRDMR